MDQRSDHVKQEGLHDIVDAVLEDDSILKRLSDKVRRNLCRHCGPPVVVSYEFLGVLASAAHGAILLLPRRYSKLREWLRRERNQVPRRGSMTCQKTSDYCTCLLCAENAFTS